MGWPRKGHSKTHFCVYVSFENFLHALSTFPLKPTHCYFHYCSITVPNGKPRNAFRERSERGPFTVHVKLGWCSKCLARICGQAFSTTTRAGKVRVTPMLTRRRRQKRARREVGPQGPRPVVTIRRSRAACQPAAHSSPSDAAATSRQIPRQQRR